jgi:hypothetical protein
MSGCDAGRQGTGIPRAGDERRPPPG